ncbi:MAG: isoprenyl transferase [Planctomycetales bacterium]|nr:isoprenyl transferase [Planctomycetales bacterium]
MPQSESLPAELADLPTERWPRHIAIIMDGNGRWAERRGLPRMAGHERGVLTVRQITEEASRLGLIGDLTLYCLSSENWKRPQEEIDFLMELLKQYMIEERPRIMNNNIQVSMLGRRSELPAEVLAEIDETIRQSSANTGMRLNLAINYGARGEIIDAVKSIVASGMKPEEVTEEAFAEHLYTAGRPDPDLLVRTAGELRISNYLLWQISYAEIWVTDLCWPDFTEATLHQAVLEYARRERRYGGLNV